jgi:hypothetical protein
MYAHVATVGKIFLTWGKGVSDITVYQLQIEFRELDALNENLINSVSDGVPDCSIENEHFTGPKCWKRM